MYKIQINEKASKEINDLEKTNKEHLKGVLERIKIEPRRFVKRLVNSPYYSFRFGNHRAIIELHEDVELIVILKVEHRKKAYK